MSHDHGLCRLLKADMRQMTHPHGSVPSQESTVKMIHKFMFVGVLLVSGTAALAQGQYHETIDFISGLRQTSYGSLRPHADAIAHTFYGSQSPDTSAKGVIEFASAPAPYVYVQVQASGMNAYLGGGLKYSFDVSGPANSFVPLNFSANFNLGNSSWLMHSDVSFNAYAMPRGLFSGPSVNAGITCGYQRLCRQDHANAYGGTASSVQVNIQGSSGIVDANGSVYGLTTAYGTITGTLMAPTNALGESAGVVDIRAFASVTVGITPASWAFIDPKFEVAPDYLVLNPSAALQILPGVGNESALMPVPEPASVWLMAGGVLGLFAALRRRKVLAKQPR